MTEEHDGRKGERKRRCDNDRLTPHDRRGEREKEKNLAAGALLPYKLKIEKGISLYDEKGEMEKSNCWSCS